MTFPRWWWGFEGQGLCYAYNLILLVNSLTGSKTLHSWAAAIPLQ
jgi:hypothetical protein